MTLSDTTEYWKDIKNNFNRFYVSYIHLKGKECNYFHKCEDDNIGNVTCPACIKLFTDEEKIEYSKIQKKREKRRRQKQNRKNRTSLEWYLADQKRIGYSFCICGKPMVKRTNRKTKEDFWGCWDYPKCKHTENIV